MEPPIVDECKQLRARIKGVYAEVFKLMDHGDLRGEQSLPFQHSEMKANIMLTYRHLEDAAMRLGKVIQAADGGVSFYDK